MAWIPTESCSSPGWSKGGGNPTFPLEVRLPSKAASPRERGSVGVAQSLQAEPTGPRQCSGRAALVIKLLIELIELLQFAGVNPTLAHRRRPELEASLVVQDISHNKGEMENVAAPGPLRVSL